MVLDTYDAERDTFIFKNTFNSEETGQTKQIEINRSDANAPKCLYFVHIEARDMSTLPTREARNRLKKQQRKEVEEQTGNKGSSLKK